MRRLIGVSISTMVGSIYNMGVWDKGTAACMKTATGRTLRQEAAARARYKGTGRSLDNGTCKGDPHVVVDRCFVFLCILHYCMAMGRLQVAFIDAHLEALPKDTTEAVQRILCGACTGVKLGSAAAPDGEESWALFLVWEELGPLLAYAPGGCERQAVLAMRDLRQEWYSNTPPTTDLRAPEVARAYRAHCGKAGFQSNSHLFLQEDVTTAVANAARFGVRLGAVCADVVEDLNAIIKRAYNDHTARGGGGRIARCLSPATRGRVGFASVGVVVS